MVEESSQWTKHANKILVSIFLTMKATILDTHGSSSSVEPKKCHFSLKAKKNFDVSLTEECPIVRRCTFA